jgi:hypothetical protein
MVRRCLPVLIAATLLSLAGRAAADEGMWPPYSIDKLSFTELKARGLQLTPEQIYNPTGGGLTEAIVQMGATASFVSPSGLIITNHHVAYGAIQEQSTPEHNYIRDGFYAPTQADEIEARGYNVNVTTGIEDVTARVLGAVNDTMTGLERFRAIDNVTKQIVAEGEKGDLVRCRVVPMFEGKQYVKYSTFEIRDVRIVYIPPEAIGNFGGETDNWMWPRHTGDFAFMRAYVGPTGAPAEYSRENIPYKPRVYLPISAAGVAEGDLTITIGFPGRTERFMSSFDLANQADFVLPSSIQNAENDVRIIEEISKQDPTIALRTADDLKGINNRLKKNRGTLEGLRANHVLEQKAKEERALAGFLAQDPTLQKQYGSVLPELEALYREHGLTQVRDRRLERLGRAGDYYRLASDLYRWSVEREKPDPLRDKGYQDRDTLNAIRRLKNAQTNLVPLVDRALFRAALEALLDLPAGQQVDVVEKLFAGETGAEREAAVGRYVNDLYERSQVGNLDARMRLFAMSRQQIEELGDPFVNLAAALYPEMEAVRERSKAFEGSQNLLAPKLVQAYAAWKNGAMYPDANGTMRISFGEVKGFHPRDAVDYHYHTLLAGVMQKESGEGEFIVPQALKQAYEAHNFGTYAQAGDNDIPVDFLTTNDITNGNSGSPVINGRGEIVGLAFDGNYEAVASDYLYDPELNRTIVVDARYILFILDKVYHLNSLMKELAIR